MEEVVACNWHRLQDEEGRHNNVVHGDDEDMLHEDALEDIDSEDEEDKWEEHQDEVCKK